ncbi:ATP-dependent DNA helicase RecQ [uncultured Duncaniella sp.]|uniref:RecQ family ATP-dependent DNA helicase n=1 Tax=uncultured Duncaniella sp. TaxID=2768039 RepID=UPI0025DC38AF|nr:ATP-dependent DNA helicase RecQ [uncultured Duncaniella sp.]
MKHSILRKYWGYDTFRPMQEEIIDSVLAGHDTLGLLPTGGGKSLTFQVPAMILPGVTIVVTPLISLMKDQVDNLADRGIRAVLFHSGLTAREKDLGMTRCRLGKAKIAYVSPERLRNERFLAELRTLTVSLLVVDEAHCISQWGYDFRPSYLRISDLRRIVGEEVPVLALTASATPEVTADIMKHLGFREPRVFSKSFTRENLSYIVRYADVKEPMLLRILSATSGCSIVYVRSRRRTRELAALLNGAGIPSEAYHAGLAPEEKEERQDRWKRDEVRVMVATNAFGMGIDKPNVRLVVHYDLPSSLEEYYQEAGRGGRDGKESLAVVIAGKRDKALLTRRVNESFPPKDFIARVYELAGNFLDVAVGEGYGMVYEFNFTLFCSTFDLPPVPTQSALHLLTRSGYVEYIEETTSRSRLMVIMRREELYDLNLDPDTEEVLQTLLRAYTGLFADYVYISELMIAERLRLSSEQVYRSLLTLSRLHAVHYVPRATTPYLVYTTSREEPRHLIIPIEVYERQRARMEARTEAMKEFVFNTTSCRAGTLLRYFGETPSKPCGKCDVCRAARRTVRLREEASAASTQLEESILYQASRPAGASVTDIIANLTPHYTSDEVIAAVRSLIDRSRLNLEGTRVKTIS